MVYISFSFPTKTNHDVTTSYKYRFNDLNVDGFDLSNGLRSENLHKLESKETLSINVFPLVSIRQVRTLNNLLFRVAEQRFSEDALMQSSPIWFIKV